LGHGTLSPIVSPNSMVETMGYNTRNDENSRQHRAMEKAKAYSAFVSLFVVLVLIIGFGPQLHGWRLWLAILASLLFAIWAGATIGSFLDRNGKTAK